MYRNYFSKQELDEVYELLSDEQKQVLDFEVKRGKKTEWLNVWAKQKGIVLTGEQLDNPEVAMEMLLDWVLIDYIDGQGVTSALKCECGRSLRYQYVVKHKKTEQIYKFGKEHFKQHTGLDDETVRLVTKGLDKIDLEKEEILTKIKCGKIMHIPTEVVIPANMSNQLRVGLPLLDRQYNRLMKEYAKQVQLPENKIDPPKSAIQLLEKKTNEMNVEDLFFKLTSKTIKSKEIQLLLHIVQFKPERLVEAEITRDKLELAITNALRGNKSRLTGPLLVNLRQECNRCL